MRSRGGEGVPLDEHVYQTCGRNRGGWVGGGELSVLVYVTTVATLVRHSVTRLVSW